MAAKSALDALNESLAANGVAVSGDPPDDEVIEGDPPGGEDPSDEEIVEGDPPDEEIVEGDPPEGDETGGEDDPDDSDETDEEKTAREAAEAAAAETPEAKATREAAEKAAARGTGDILEDPIPKDVTKRTQDRMVKLIETVKEYKPDAEFGRELMGHITASQMTADEFNMALVFGRYKHSDSIEDNRKAYAILWQGLKELAPLIGESLPGVDPLEGHPDLQLRVTAKTLDAKDAAEMAAGRNRRKADSAAATRASQHSQTEQQRAQQSQQLEASVKKELNALGHELFEQDKQFEAKMKTMTKAQKAGIANSPPGLRVAAFLKTYLSLKVPVRVAAPASGKPKPQPMRAGKVPAAGGNGVRREPKSAVEAMDFALGLK